MKTPERSVEEILENLYANKPFLVPTVKFEKTELKYGDWLWFENWLTQTLQAERQRCEEVKLQAEKEILKCVTAEDDNCYYLRVAKDSPLFITK